MPTFSITARPPAKPHLATADHFGQEAGLQHCPCTKHGKALTCMQADVVKLALDIWDVGVYLPAQVVARGVVDSVFGLLSQRKDEGGCGDGGW